MSKPRRNECLLCENGKPESPKLFRLPTNPEQRKKWLTIIKREDLIDKDAKYNREARVCKKHFQDWCFTSTLHDNLVRFALPNTDPVKVCPSVLEPKEDTSRNKLYRVIKLSRAQIEELKKKRCKIIFKDPRKQEVSTTSNNGLTVQPSSTASLNRDHEKPSSSASVGRDCEQPSSPASVGRDCEQPSSPASSIGGNYDQPSSPAHSIGGNYDQPSSPASVAGKSDQPSSPVVIKNNCAKPSSAPVAKISVNPNSSVTINKNCEKPSIPLSSNRPSETISNSQFSLNECFSFAPITKKYKPVPLSLTVSGRNIPKSDLHELVANQRREIYKQRSMIRHLKKKLEALRAENLKFQKNVMEKLNTERYSFLKSLIKQLGTKTNSGSRWTEKDKEFAHACYVLSPKVYRMLRFKLGFPSKSTITRSLKLKANALQASPIKTEPVSEESNEGANQASVLEVDESAMAVNQLMVQNQTLEVNESTGAFFNFLESMESMNESQVRQVVEIIEAAP